LIKISEGFDLYAAHQAEQTQTQSSSKTRNGPHKLRPPLLMKRLSGKTMTLAWWEDIRLRFVDQAEASFAFIPTICFASQLCGIP
jgi:hypothetical protein